MLKMLIMKSLKMKKMIKNKFIIILAVLSFAFSYDVYWEPINPNLGDTVEIFVDVSKDDKFKNSFPMYIHFKNNNIITYKPMSLNYKKGPLIWSYSTTYDESISFAIDNGSVITSTSSHPSGELDFIIIDNIESLNQNVSIYSDDFYEA